MITYRDVAFWRRWLFWRKAFNAPPLPPITEDTTHTTKETAQ